MLKVDELAELVKMNDARKNEFQVGETVWVLDTANKSIDESEIVEINGNAYMPFVCVSNDKRFACSVDIVYKMLEEAENEAAKIEREREGKEI